MSNSANAGTMGSKRLRLGSILRPLGITLLLFIFLFPIAAIILISFQGKSDALSWPPKLLFRPTWENYINIFSLYPFGEYLRNSLLVTTAATGLSLILGLPAAYALTRLQIRQKENIALWFLSLRVLP